MESNTQAYNSIVLACSGASDLGELTDRLARKLMNNNGYTMRCLAMVAADNKELINDLQHVDTLVIDGCEKDCGKKIMEEAWLSNYRYIRLTDMGFIKDQISIDETTINKVYEKILNSEDENRIIHQRPVTNSCYNEESCDMFDFMSEHVGRKILHPGGAEATDKLMELLNIDRNRKVLDIACGKGLTSVYMAKKYGCKVIGIDILEKSIEEARMNAKKHGVEHLVTFQVADAQKLPFADNEFDITLAQAMLILVKDKVKVISEANRVLKTGGKSGWLELSWKQNPSKEFSTTASEEICALCIANVESYLGWEGTFKNGGSADVNLWKFDMDFQGMMGTFKDEGIMNGLRIMYKYIAKPKIRARMKKLHNFFKQNKDMVGYGIYLTRK